VSRAWTWALRACAIAAVAPLWCVHLPPFSDLPEQVAVMATIRHWWEPAWRLQEHYTLEITKSQYLLYHLAGALLSVVVGSAELANRLILSAVGVAYPYALRALLRAAKRDERLALFGAAVFWSRPLVIGFLPYVASVPAVAWGLAMTMEHARAPSRRSAVRLGALATALFYLHANGYVLFLVASTAVTFEIARQRAAVDRAAAALFALRGLPRRMLWIAPSLALAAAWSAFGSLGRGGAALHGGADVSYIPNAELLREFPQWAHDIWLSHVDEWCAAGLWAAFAALVLQRGAKAPADAAPGDGAPGGGAARGDDVSWVPFACALVAYFALPYRVAAGGMLNVRIAVFVVLFAPLLVRPMRGLRTSLALGAIGACALVTAANAAVEMRGAERDELGDLDRLVDRIPEGARVLTLTFHVTSSHVHFVAPYTFVGAYHRARAGGVSSYSFSDLVHWPVRYRPPAAPPPKRPFWTFDSCEYRNATDGAYFDYVLTRGNVDPFRDEPPGPRWQRVDATRDWALFAKLPGATSPAWTVDDGGPCESRRSLERAAPAP